MSALQEASRFFPSSWRKRWIYISAFAERISGVVPMSLIKNSKKPSRFPSPASPFPCSSALSLGLLVSSRRHFFPFSLLLDPECLRDSTPSNPPFTGRHFEARGFKAKKDQPTRAIVVFSHEIGDGIISLQSFEIVVPSCRFENWKNEISRMSNSSPFLFNFIIHTYNIQFLKKQMTYFREFIEKEWQILKMNLKTRTL